ncbi:MAG: DUF1343 domain-containing protein [Flavobacteriales bacterium]|nr:DUF1343 domain-containing protein [Flavobacteriales bacterium]
MAARKILSLLLFWLAFNASGQDSSRYANEILVGAELSAQYIKLFTGKRIAVVGNQTSMVGEEHLVDFLLGLGMDIKKVFAPEHGFRGKADAGERINDGLDAKTGLPIKSLHGRRKKPSKEDLFDVDMVVFDIQDVGVRFYTYISTMHYVMEACAEQNKLFVVLDRPNPNGFYVDGPILKMDNKSFVGMHPVPIVHGMTIGEYAKMINGEGWLKNNIQCDLKVVKCANYEHSDYYQLPVKPSPNLPNMSSIYLYPSLCLFEGTQVSVGRGTDLQFQIIGSPFNDKGDYKFTPESKPGATKPKHMGIDCLGYNLTEFGDNYMHKINGLYLNWLVAFYKNSTDQEHFFRKDGFFRLLTGDVSVRKMIEEGHTADAIVKTWNEELDAFKKVRSKYLLYPDFE